MTRVRISWYETHCHRAASVAGHWGWTLVCISRPGKASTDRGRSATGRSNLDSIRLALLQRGRTACDGALADVAAYSGDHARLAAHIRHRHDRVVLQHVFTRSYRWRCRSSLLRFQVRAAPEDARHTLGRHGSHPRHVVDFASDRAEPCGAVSLVEPLGRDASYRLPCDGFARR